MIEEKDLMIGNHINSTRSTCLFAKGEIKIDKRDLITILRYGAEFLEPIPLTEEWNNKLGFENGCLGRFSIGLMDDDFVKGQFTLRFKGAFIKVKYVHKLQNICYELGEELTIKEL